MNLALLAERDLSQRGERARLWFEERSYSNRELYEASQRLAGALSALSVSRDERVMLFLPNGPELLISVPAIWRVGAIVVPVLPHTEARELAYLAQSSSPKMAITTLDLLPILEHAFKRARVSAVTLVVTEGRGDPTAPALSFERTLAHGDPYGDAATRAGDDLAAIVFTSGATSSPKGAMLTHRNLEANVENTELMRGPRDDVSLLVMPLAHSLGLATLLRGYLFGTRGILCRRFKPDTALRLIERHRTTSMIGVPTMFAAMLDVHEPHDTSNMQRWWTTGSALPPTLIAAFEQRFKGTVSCCYELSEVGTVTAERVGEPRKAGACGRPLDGLRMMVSDSAGAPLALGQIGEICVAGEAVTIGYYGQAEASRAAFRNGWLRTGDVGYLDADAQLFVIERLRDLIVRGGSTIHPLEIEEMLMRHPSVLDCALVGVPDPLLGEELCACVVTRANLPVENAALLAYCQANLPKYKAPHYLEFLPGLPRTPSGKVKRRELRAWVLKKLAGQG